jgi:hypothetical protein
VLRSQGKPLLTRPVVLCPVKRVPYPTFPLTQE